MNLEPFSLSFVLICNLAWYGTGIERAYEQAYKIVPRESHCYGLRTKLKADRAWISYRSGQAVLDLPR